ncbi:alkaline phosphatase [Prosthecobacter fusiformis]|uniref:Alkaline phosphatase n=1 Tax=Prosthecobacter fusiformis TaxID=48464 RepID=A0A4R7RK99_9BACT|nr:metallophosphoesterase [Prosthecobacter fusiformis]TDU64561.1 alkaline phosphatase [Prosthecobacter fusiformis]
MNSRRAFIHQGSLCLAGLGAGKILAAETEAQPILRVGLMTDLHYADKEATKTRFYREALSKLDEAVEFMNREKPAAVIELGDFIDQAPTVEQELEWLKTMEQHYAKLAMPRHYVLGNHCVGTLTKAEFAAHTGAALSGYSSFEKNGIRFILLDACFREDGIAYGRSNFHWKDCHIPAQELSWLKDELARATGPVIVMAHQRLDMDVAHAVKNAAEVRAILEQSKKVLAVFQGHSHKNDLQQINGIPYCTLVAMIEGSGQENNGYTLLDVLPDSSLRLNGFRKQTSHIFTS